MAPSGTCAAAAALLLAGLARAAVPAEQGGAAQWGNWSQACVAEEAAAGLMQVRHRKLPKKQFTSGASAMNASAGTGLKKIGEVCFLNADCDTNRCAGSSNGGEGICKEFGGSVTITLIDISGCTSVGQTNIINSFNDAAAKYSRVLLGQWIEPSLDLDIQIEWSLEYIDGTGGILGSAGPRSLLTFNVAGYSGLRVLPSAGLMRFDVDDLGAGGPYEDIARGVILHEMGHVLGIGTLWQPGSGYFSMTSCSCFGSQPASGGWYYTPDMYASTAYQRSGGYLPSGFPGFDKTPPIEADQGGCGTRCGHWDEGVLQSELMTGYASGGTECSSITIGGYEDLGYTVDYTEAEAYTVPLARRRRKPTGFEYDAHMLHPTDFTFIPYGTPHLRKVVRADMEAYWNETTALFKTLALQRSRPPNSTA